MNRVTIIGLLSIIIVIIIGVGYYILDEKSGSSDTDIIYQIPNTKPLPISTDQNIWNQYRNTLSHDGRAHPNTSLKGKLIETWMSRDLNQEYYGASKSSPAVDKDLIFIGADTGHLYAFNRTNGKEVWKFQSRPSMNGIHGSPAFDDENLYIGAYDGWLYALNKNNGTLVWEVQLGDYIGSSPCLFEGVVYIGVEMDGPSGYLIGCNASSGSIVFRSSKFGSHPHSTPSIDPVRDYIYIGANDKHIYCYDLTSKKEVWNFKTSGEIKSTPCIAGDVLYITSWDNRLYCLDLENGTKYFSFKTDQKTMSSPTIDSAGERIYFGSHDRNLYCINAKNGTLVWKYKTGSIILSSPTLVERDGYVICGSNDKNVYILDLESGKNIKIIEIESGISSVPVVVDNQMYIFDNEGRLHRFDAS
jgi:outer membrane protein assembly factor BamB